MDVTMWPLTSIDDFEICWRYVGNMLERCWKDVGNMLEICWKYVGNLDPDSSKSQSSACHQHMIDQNSLLSCWKCLHHRIFKGDVGDACPWSLDGAIDDIDALIQQVSIAIPCWFHGCSWTLWCKICSNPTNPLSFEQSLFKKLVGCARNSFVADKPRCVPGFFFSIPVG